MLKYHRFNSRGASLKFVILIVTFATALVYKATAEAAGRIVCEVGSAAATEYRDDQWSLKSVGADEAVEYYVVDLEGPSVTQVGVIWSWEPNDCSIMNSYQTGEAKQLRCSNNGYTLTFSLDLVSLRFFVLTLLDDFHQDTNVNDFAGTIISTGGCVEVGS